MQDLLALAVACLAAAWLARRLASRLLAQPCRPPAAGGADGFIPLDTLTMSARTADTCPQKKPGRPEGRPGMSVSTIGCDHPG